MSRGISKLEEKLKEGVYGKRDLNKEERKYFLGELEERVIRYLTADQLMEKGTYPEIIEAIKHPAARKLIIDRDIELSAANDYIRHARENKLLFKRVHSPEFKGDIALIVVSDHAVDVADRKVLSRAERLKERGISDKIIRNPGARLCEKCWLSLEAKAPEELDNYKKIGFIDKIIGTKCVCE